MWSLTEAKPTPTTSNATNIITRSTSPTNELTKEKTSQTLHKQSPDLSRLVAATLEHETAIPEEIPVKATVGKFGLMHPTKQALEHEAAGMLLDWAEN